VVAFFKHIALPLLLFLYSFPFIAAQTIQFSTHTIDDGLSQGTILASLQDSKGYLWFGTADGLNCFNGYEFTVYRNKPDDSNSLLDNEIMALVEDELGNIWIGTALGLCRYTPSTQQFTHFQYEASDTSSLSNNYVNFLFQDAQQQIWIGTKHGLNLYQPATESFTRFYQGGSKENSAIDKLQVNAIAQDKDKNLWIGFEDGLCLLRNQKLQPLQEVYQFEDAVKLQKITALLCDATGVIWVGSEQTLCRISPKEAKIEIVANKYIHSLYSTQNGAVWVGTKEGVLVLEKKMQQAANLETGKLYKLPNNNVHSILEDYQGSIWVGTGSGLSRYNPLTSQFNTTRIAALGMDDFTKNKVWAIAQWKDLVLLGTEGGLYSYDSKKGIQSFPLFSHFRISTIKVQADKIWLGTWDDGLLLWNPAKGTYKKYKHNPSDTTTVNNNTIRSIAIDKKGILWVGTPKGLNQYLPRTNSFEYFQFHTQEGQYLKTNSIITIYPDRSGMLWLGTEGGVVCFRKNKGEVNIFRADATKANSLSHDFVRVIIQSKEGTIWLGTSGGLNKWSMDKMAFTPYRMKDGLPNDVIYSILEANDGTLWLSTNKGLSRFDTEQSVFKNFDKGDGLQGSEFNTNAALKTPDGRLYFGGLKGFNYFIPEQIKINIVPPPVVISCVEVLNKSSKKPVRKPIFPKEDLQLSYEDYMFTFHFAALNFINSEKNQYQYMLDGFDLDWNEAGNKRTATYTNLQKGNYIFKVRAANNSGVWNEEISSVKVHITPPFWLTQWFAFLIISLLILILMASYYIRTKSIRKKNNELEQLVQERTTSLSEKQKKLASRESLFRSFYEGSPLGIIYLDGKNAGKIIRCNKQIAKMLEYSQEEMVGSQMMKYVHRKDLAQKAGKFMTALQEKKELVFFKLCRLFKKNGEMIYVNAYTSFHYNEKKELDYIISMIVNETEDVLAQQKLKKAEIQLIEINKMAALGQLTAGVAHEINNPVNFIYSGISSLRKNINALLNIVSQYDKLQTAEDFVQKQPIILEQKEQIDYDLVLEDIEGLMDGIKNGANRTTEIVKSLQVFSREDKLKLQKTNIHKGLDATFHILEREIKDKVVIEKNYDKELEEIECFPGQLNQVFLNILFNAIQAIPTEGVITITTKNEQEQILITIKDNGLGIPKEILSRIFEPFFTTKEVGQGTGLGLSICYNIIKKHKGTIKASSKEGEGTTFIITLPKIQSFTVAEHVHTTLPK